MAVDKLVNIPNRELLYDVYAYITDMRSTLALVNSYIKWLGMTTLSCIRSCTTNFSRCSFSFSAPTIWNALPAAIRESNAFKRRLKTHLTSLYIRQNRLKVKIQ